MSANAIISDFTGNRSDHKVVSREQWLIERKKLLAAEKELTRRSDDLARQRQQLPWVRIDKDYRFENETGSVSLADLFQGRSQLIIYHFMFGPDFTVGCPSCSAIADGFDNIGLHLANHDVMLGAVSRAPFAKLQAYKQRMGWKFPWASSFDGDFNFDFHVSFTGEQQRAGTVDYNYRVEPADDWRECEEGSEGAEDQFAASCGTNTATYISERPGMSTFIMKDNAIYHAYSSFSRGLDVLWGMYQWLDRAPLGRNETAPWWRRHDEYGTPDAGGGSCCCSSSRKTEACK